MFPCKKLLEFDLEMVLNFSENANILEYEIKFEKNSRACDWLSETWDMGLLFERARRFRLVSWTGQKGRMEREYADVLIDSGELSRPGYRSPTQSGIIAKITKLVESRISQLKKGTATGQHDAEVDDNLDLFCRAIIEHRQEHVEKGKVAQRKKEVDKHEGEQHREQAFQTFKGNQHVVDVDGS